MVINAITINQLDYCELIRLLLTEYYELIRVLFTD